MSWMFGLVSLFNMLIFELFNAKVILVEEQ